jgi:hypothetical protein
VSDPGYKKKKLNAAIDQILESGTTLFNARELAKQLNLTNAEIGMLLRENRSEEYELKKEPVMDGHRYIPHWRITPKSKI